jgi:hypothetical protein
MISHVVLFKLKEFDNEDQKAVVRNRIKNALLNLKDKIGELKYIEVGLNHQLNSDSFDVCLFTRFDTLEDLNSYQIHPEHLKVAEMVKTNAVVRATVDYESKDSF